MIMNRYALLKWNNANKKRYVDLGYTFTSMGDVFKVDIKDLSSSSKAIIKIKCDFCGKEYDKVYKDWKCRHSGFDDLDACSSYNCRSAKTQLTNMAVYGCNCVFKNEDIKTKIRKTMVDKYGAEYNMQIPEIKNKFHQTMQERYGVDWYSQTDGFGSQYWDTRLENGNVPTSKVEDMMCKSLIEMFGDNAIPSYHMDKIVMDCRLELNNCKIDIEYDGQYWHKDRVDMDANRDKFVHMNGYKVLRVKGNYIPPTKEELKDAINHLIYSDDIYCEIIKDIE